MRSAERDIISGQSPARKKSLENELWCELQADVLPTGRENVVWHNTAVTKSHCGSANVVRETKTINSRDRRRVAFVGCPACSIPVMTSLRNSFANTGYATFSPIDY